MKRFIRKSSRKIYTIEDINNMSVFNIYRLLFRKYIQRKDGEVFYKAINKLNNEYRNGIHTLITNTNIITEEDVEKAKQLY